VEDGLEESFFVVFVNVNGYTPSWYPALGKGAVDIAVKLALAASFDY
jgi:hypothetical protein